MIVAVTGGRNYADRERVFEALDKVHGDSPITLLVHGAATGADSLAAEWAARRQVAMSVHPARWDDLDTPPVKIAVNAARKPYNVLAGFNRNIRMLEAEKPDLLVAFSGGKGTAHCQAQALKRSIPCLEFDA